MKRWSDRILASALLGALAAAAAAPARAGDLGGRIILSWQSYTSGNLETEGLHQLYDLRLGRALTDSLRLRFTFRGEDDGSGSTLLGERRTRDTRQLQPGFRLLYSVGALQLQGDWDRLQTRFSNSDGPDSDRRQDWLRTRLTYRPDGLPGLTVEGTRRRGSDPANALDLTETRSTVRLDYSWHGLQAAAIHQTLDFEDVAAGYDRRSSALQGNLGYSASFWDDRFAVQANAYSSRGRIDVRSLGGGTYRGSQPRRGQRSPPRRSTIRPRTAATSPWSATRCSTTATSSTPQAPRSARTRRASSTSPSTSAASPRSTSCASSPAIRPATRC